MQNIIIIFHSIVGLLVFLIFIFVFRKLRQASEAWTGTVFDKGETVRVSNRKVPTASKAWYIKVKKGDGKEASSLISEVLYKAINIGDRIEKESGILKKPRMIEKKTKIERLVYYSDIIE